MSNKKNIWNKGMSNEEWLSHYKKGHPKGMLGKKHLEESKNKIKEKLSLIRLKNNPMKNPEVAKKVSITLKRLYLEGKIINPNKGKHIWENKRHPHFGKEKSEETKLKLSLANRGKHSSLNTEFKKGQISLRKGIKLLEETKQKISLAKLGKPNPKCSETKKRLYAEGKLKSWNKGTKGLMKAWSKGLTKETDERIKNIAEKISVTRKKLFKEGKLKMSEKHKDIWKIHPHPRSMKGKKHSEETKRKIREKNIGRKHTKDSINKMREIRKEWYLINPDKALLKARKVGITLKLKGVTKGEKNPNWRGGIAFEPYTPEFNKELKGKIREKYNFKCAECDYSEKDLGHTLHIHHIDYNKKNNSENNLIPLCANCHSQTNFNRENWTKYYQEKVIK